MMTKIEKLLLLPNRVFTVSDLNVIWGIKDPVQLWNQIRYYLRIKKLTRVHKGVYAVGEYEELEVAQKLVVPSYVSVYTALATHGIVFQYYQTIHSMALVSKSIKRDSQQYSYHKLKEEIFYNPLGIQKRETYFIAEPERAICDSLYLYPSLSFDNLHQINSEKLRQISEMYENKRLTNKVKQIIKQIEFQE